MITNPILDETQKNRPDPMYPDFLMKKWLFISIWWALFIWACVFSYIFFLTLTEGAILWTILSLPITYIGITLPFYPFMKWYNRKFVENHWWVLGEKKLFVKRGVFTSHLARIDYERIQNVNLVQSFLEKMLGFYRIQIETAGSSAQTSEGRLMGLKNPEEMVRAITEKTSVHDIVEKISENTSKYGGIVFENNNLAFDQFIAYVLSKLQESGKMKSKIKELRKKKNLTQAELADKCNVTRQTIIYLEQGKYVPSLTLAMQLAKILGVIIEEIFELEDSDINKKRGKMD
ncbi:hypothetical protein NEF87_000646 [Candidatus Lokiarchaeum ossiferum]|uniref:HTH cro/C1-type domain-containing protein n=1 Tax=Candidatus Lokiarchaeum ossiferum TaxID=2951803 RepID=A0ABY6HLS8_9ARCH|nr:hypothetical protein NEF87_000646 [Candidatus Lokiarchaeum sp. B-35]